MGIADVFQKPIALKGMIANYNIGFLDSILDSAIFFHTKREMCSNIASALEARKSQLGSEKEWYSFRIPEMKLLMQMEDAAMQVAGQIYYTNSAIEKALEKVSEERKIEIQYEDFCEDSEKYYQLLQIKFKKQGYYISENYYGNSKFEVTKKEYQPEIEKKLLNTTL